MSTFQSFEELEAWKACRAFRIHAYHQIVKKLIALKEFYLADQLISALDERHITEKEFEPAKELYLHALKVLNGYMSYLQRSNKGK